MNTSNRHISLREWRTFCAVAKNRSFRLAAEQLFITASAVSHQVKNLEDDLGKKLFERGTRAISLTRDGELLFADVHPLINELHEITLRHRVASPRTALRISVQPFFASEQFVPRLHEFQQQHQNIDITVDTNDASSERHPVSADVSIRIFKTPPKGLNSVPLFPLRLIPAGSAELYDSVKVRAGRIVSDFPIIIHEQRPRAWQLWEKSSGIRLPSDVRSVKMDSMFAVARAAERGLGAALMPVGLSDRWFRDSSLVPLFDHELQTRDTYYFVTDDQSGNRENIKVLRDWVLQTFDHDS
ncbi:MAG: LysR family transcriptional regulator [Woeseiaceae bacterium]|nr:LysR family transcriptional regulator [Woeseiaceae bacterium]